MANSLNSLNAFLASSSDQPVSTSAIISSYSQESIVIDANTKEYLTEVNFLNPDNDFEGTFWHVNSDGKRIDIYNSILSALSLSANINDVSAENLLMYKGLSATLDQKLSASFIKTQEYCINASYDYTNRKVYSSLLAYNDRTDELSNTTISHINNDSIHVKKDGTLQEGLNAEKLDGYSYGQIINEATRNTISEINNNITLDCGKI